MSCQGSWQQQGGMRSCLQGWAPRKGSDRAGPQRASRKNCASPVREATGAPRDPAGDKPHVSLFPEGPGPSLALETAGSLSGCCSGEGSRLPKAERVQVGGAPARGGLGVLPPLENVHTFGGGQQAVLDSPACHSALQALQPSLPSLRPRVLTVACSSQNPEPPGWQLLA